MNRAFLLVIVPLVAAAAPVPKAADEEKWKRRIGEIVDPDKDCKFTFAADSFGMTVPGANHTTDRRGLLGKAPRSETTAKGVFELVVRADWAVEITPTPGHTATLFARAGLYVRDHEQVAYLARQYKRGPKEDAWEKESFLCRSDSSGQSISSVSHGVKPTAPQYLRLVRRDDVVTGFTGTDGKTWEKLGEKSLKNLPNEVTVGVFVEHNTDHVVEVRFDKFSLDRP